MRYTEIYYRTLKDNTEHVEVVYYSENPQAVLNKIESITDAKDEDGKQVAVVFGIAQHK